MRKGGGWERVGGLGVGSEGRGVSNRGREGGKHSSEGWKLVQ